MSTEGIIDYLKGYAANTNKAVDFGSGFSFSDMLLELLSANTNEKLGAFILKHGALSPIQVSGKVDPKLEYQIAHILLSKSQHDRDEFRYNGFERFLIWSIYELHTAVTNKNIPRCREALGWLHVISNPEEASDYEVLEISKEYIIRELEENVKDIKYRMKWNDDTNRFERSIFAPALMCCMYYALMNMITGHIPMRTCANPTCGNVFAIYGEDYRKMYCSLECKNMVKQRRYRAKLKQKKEAHNGEHTQG